MTDWYLHEPGRGRTGPFDDDALRARFRRREITLDTLGWHADARDWLPLARHAEALGLDRIVPDAALPPPLPPASQHAASKAAAAGPASTAAPQRRLSGCLVAALIGGALALVGLAVLAAIALPAYRDYVLRSQLGMGTEAPVAALRTQVAAHAARYRRCPGNADAGFAAADAYATGPIERIVVGELQDGRCAFELRLRDPRTRRPLGTVVHAAALPSDAPEWDCSGGTLSSKYRLGACRGPTDTSGSP